jgi:peptidoglycan hydrolase-like protein with peptidoglycan-binding domain
MLLVKQYQKNLHHYYAYYNGNIDGICGAQTKAAVKRFQKGHGLTQDGIYGRIPMYDWLHRSRSFSRS